MFKSQYNLQTHTANYGLQVLLVQVIACYKSIKIDNIGGCF